MLVTTTRTATAVAVVVVAVVAGSSTAPPQMPVVDDSAPPQFDLQCGAKRVQRMTTVLFWVVYGPLVVEATSPPWYGPPLTKRPPRLLSQGSELELHATLV
jgi:hypothetical protein